MITAFFELMGLLLKGQQLTVNTAITLLILAGTALGLYVAIGNDHHLTRIDNHLRSEDTDIGLMRQSLDDHGIHVNEPDRYESPRARGEDEDMNDNRDFATTNHLAANK